MAVDIVLYHYAEYLRRRLKIKAVGWEHYCLDSRQGPLLSYSRRLSVKNAYATVVISDGDYKSYKGKYPWAKNIVLRSRDYLSFADSGAIFSGVK